MRYKIVKIFILNILLITPLFSFDAIKILNKNYITVGVDYEHKPFAFINKNGKVDGFEIDIIKNIIDRLNISIKFVEVTSKNKESMLLRNKVDIIIATIPENQLKNKKIILSKSYLSDKQVLLVKKDFDTYGVFSLVNKKIGTINSSIYLDKFLKLKSNSNMITFASYLQLVKALYYNNIDAITADFIWAKTYEKDFGNRYKVLDYNIATNSYHMAMKSEKLKDIIDEKLDEINNDNTYNNIYKKWFLSL